MQEKVNLEKTEHENAQWFWNLLHKKLAELRCDMEESVVALEWGGGCMDFPATNATISSLLDWFWTEVRVVLIAFAKCNKNINCFTLVGVFKVLAGVECEHLPDLKKLTLSYDASILLDVPDDIGRIAKKPVKN
jgi:hypothetical protein